MLCICPNECYMQIFKVQCYRKSNNRITGKGSILEMDMNSSDEGEDLYSYKAEVNVENGATVYACCCWYILQKW